MKIFLLLSITFFSLQNFATATKDRSALITSMANFSEKEKLTEKDIPELTQQLKNILILEQIDDSHEGPFELTTSYPKNKNLYQKVIKTFNKKEQKVLQDILKIVEKLSIEGNG